MRKLSPEDFSSTELTLRGSMGPQDDCFTAAGIETFLGLHLCVYQ